MTINFIRRDHANIILIIILLIFENVLYLEKSVLCVVFHLKLLCLYDFQACNTSLNTVSYSSLYMLYGLSDEIWHVGNAVCYGSCILRMCDIRNMSVLEMWDIGDVRC